MYIYIIYIYEIKGDLGDLNPDEVRVMFTNWAIPNWCTTAPLSAPTLPGPPGPASSANSAEPRRPVGDIWPGQRTTGQTRWWYIYIYTICCISYIQYQYIYIYKTRAWWLEPYSYGIRSLFSQHQLEVAAICKVLSWYSTYMLGSWNSHWQQDSISVCSSTLFCRRFSSSLCTWHLCASRVFHLHLVKHWKGWRKICQALNMSICFLGIFSHQSESKCSF